jgi:subtilisin family serine protease
MRNISELPVGSGDPFWPLRFLDARFEPRDPIFDPDEVEEPRPRRRRKKVAALAIAVAAIGCGGSAGPALHATDSILVQLEPGAAPPAGHARTEYGPPIVALEWVAPDGEPPLLRVPLERGTDAELAAEQLAREPGIAFAEPVYIYRSSRAPNDPRFKDLWGLSRIGAPGAWAHTVGDRKVTVAVVDDGVALDHPDLKDNLWTNPQEIPGNGQDDDGDGVIDDAHGASFQDGAATGDPSPAPNSEARWHGSHVSGIIGAAGDNHLGVVGVNWSVALMAVRGLGPSGGRSDDLARSIDYAVDHGARVINASWGGGGKSRALMRSIERAGKHGALFVAAAGNGSAARPDFPAAFEGVLSVGAATPDDVLAPFSNRGALLAAPGVGILSTTAPGQYERYDGTSMAASHVSGAAALLWAAHPGASLAQVTKALLDSAVSMSGVEYGRLDVAKALGELENGSGESASLALSRDSLAFAASAGRRPRAQTVLVRAHGGAARRWKAAADRSWISLRPSEGETPARISVLVDPAKLEAGTHSGTVQVEGGPALRVGFRIGDTPPVTVASGACEMRGGALHAPAGAGCALQVVEGESAGVRWVLPGGRQSAGSRFYGQFVRPGQFTLLVSRDEGEVDGIPVVIE